MAKQKASKKSKAKSGKNTPADFPAYDNKIVEFFEKKWSVPLIYFVLSLIYFAKFIFQDFAFFTTDGGVLGSIPNLYEDFKNPFIENALWYNLSMGGQPAEVALVEYIRKFFLLVLFFIDSPYRAQAVYLSVLTFAAGTFMYLFVRQLNIRKPIAFVAGLFYMFSPIFLSFTYAGHLSKMAVIALMPLMFVCLHKGFSTAKIKYFIMLSGVMAGAIFSAHLQYAYFSFWAVGFYFIFNIVTYFKETKSLNSTAIKTGLFTFSVAFALIIAARGFVPNYWHTVNHSKRASTSVERTDEQKFTFASSYPLNPEEGVSVFLPHFVSYMNDYWGRNFLKLNSEYFGLLPFVLLFASLFLVKRDRRLIFFWFLFAFSFLFALGANTPFYKLCYYLIPGVKSLRAPSMIGFLFSFSAITIMAIVLENLFTSRSGKEASTFSEMTKYVLYVAGGISFIIFLAPNAFLSFWNSIFDIESAWSTIGLTPAGMQQKRQIMSNNASNISTDALMAVFIIVVLIALLFAYKNKKIGMGLIALVIGTLSVVDTWRINKDFLNPLPYNSITNQRDIKVPALEKLIALDRTPYRVFPEHEIGNQRADYPGVAYPFYFLDFTLERYDRIKNIFDGTVSSRRTVHYPLLNLLSVKYYVASVDRNFPWHELKITEDPLKVYENKNALPYYGFFSKYRVLTETNQLLNTVLSSNFTESNEVIIEKEPPAFMQSFANSGQAADTTSTVKFLDTEDFYSGRKNTFSFRVQSNSPGFFYLSENYHPDWEVKVNGEVVDLYRANYLWKGVFLQPGTSNIVFEFKPKVLQLSRTISFIGIFAFIVLLVLSLFFDRKKEPEENSIA